MNWVYDVWVTGANDDTAVHRCSTRSNPFVAPAFVEALARQYDGDFARQELDAEWVADQQGTLIEWRHLEAARTRRAAYDPKGGPVHAGLDVAGPGEDESVLVVRQGPGILDLRCWGGPDPRGDVLDALRTWRHRGLASVAVDTAGLGHYFARHLEDAGITVVDVNVGEAPSSDAAKEQHANLKAEAYWSLRQRFVDGDVAGLTDRTMLAQLAGLRYQHDARGRVKIESKADAVKRGQKSPDRAEALMLCFAPDPNQGLADLYRAPLAMRLR
jgi:phage terminase large subunit